MVVQTRLYWSINILNKPIYIYMYIKSIEDDIILHIIFHKLLIIYIA